MCFATRKTPCFHLILPKRMKERCESNRARAHTRRVNVQKSTTHKGGRPPKDEQERASVKLNCWVTIAENEQLRFEYGRARAGKRLAFSSYLKQKLLQERTVKPSKTNEIPLTILINLQDRSRQLDEIATQLSKKDGIEAVEISKTIRVELTAIQDTLTNISQWLYES